MVILMKRARVNKSQIFLLNRVAENVDVDSAPQKVPLPKSVTSDSFIKLPSQQKNDCVNIAKIATAVQCHSLLSVEKTCKKYSPSLPQSRAPITYPRLPPRPAMIVNVDRPMAWSSDNIVIIVITL